MQPTGPQTPSMQGDRKYERQAWYSAMTAVGLFVLLMAVAVGAIVILGLAHAGRFEFALPILLVVSVGAVFVTFAVLVPIYKRAELTDPKEALGLPRGSIRALIALFIIVMFMITTVFLDSRVGARERTIERVGEKEFAALISQGHVIASMLHKGTKHRRDVTISVEPAASRLTLRRGAT